jgi:hypothetical protein
VWKQKRRRSSTALKNMTCGIAMNIGSIVCSCVSAQKRTILKAIVVDFLNLLNKRSYRHILVFFSVGPRTHVQNLTRVLPENALTRTCSVCMFAFNRNSLHTILTLTALNWQPCDLLGALHIIITLGLILAIKTGRRTWCQAFILTLEVEEDEVYKFQIFVQVRIIYIRGYQGKIFELSKEFSNLVSDCKNFLV